MSDNRKVSSGERSQESVPLIAKDLAKDCVQTNTSKSNEELINKKSNRRISITSNKTFNQKNDMKSVLKRMSLTFASTETQLFDYIDEKPMPSTLSKSYDFDVNYDQNNPNSFTYNTNHNNMRTVYSDSDFYTFNEMNEENDSQIKSKTSPELLEMSNNCMRKSLSAENGNNDNQNHRFQVAKVSDECDSDRNAKGLCHQTSIDNTNTIYDTKYFKSLRHYTREALPRVDNYRNILSVHGHMTRPTLDELHGVQTTIHPEANKTKDQQKNRGEVNTENAVKFGWIQGVLVRCLLNIWGVMLFLRLSWVAAQAGIGLGSVVILLATVVTTITSISMSAICTNGEVRGGGTYYMISRCLGPEFGGAIGVIFSVANAVAVAMYAVGFAEAFRDLLMTNGAQILDGGLNDIRIISCVTICLLLGIAIIGTEWETKAQIVLLIILLAAMIDFMIGSVIPPNDDKKSKGYIGWNGQLIVDNFMPRFEGQTFFSVFSVFFPAATGILAGANISGDLKDPQSSIPRGTLLAIAITTASYLLFLFICGATVLRDSNGLIDFVQTYPSNYTYYTTNCMLSPNGKCSYGSLHFYQVVELISAFGPLIYAGIFAATLSSALASLVSAPKVFQALCKDRLFPFIEYFGKGFGKNNEPRRGYILAFSIALACCIIGDLNAIAPIISNFFLAAYCLINFSCFHASFAKSPGFRPAFKYYNMWCSLLGAILCLIVMFITDWSTALITFVICLALYLWILHRKPDVNWGSSTQAQTYRSALHSVYRLNLVPDHVKNFRPQILVLTGNPSFRPPLVDFAYSISKGIGLIVCGHVVTGSISQRARNSLIQESNLWLLNRKIKGFYNLVEENSLNKGVKSMIQSVGIGKLRPNVVLIGMKSNWQTCEPEDVIDYFNTIHNVFDKHLSLVILRLPNGLDYSCYGRISEMLEGMNENGMIPSARFLNASYVSIDVSKEDIRQNGHHLSALHISSRGSISSRESTPSTPSSRRDVRAQQPYSISDNPSGINAIKDVPKDVLMAVNQFQRKQKKGNIDVWWLYDDGGLTLLLPFLLSTRGQWKGCKLRVFALANKKNELDSEQRNMAALLSKFRIDYSDVKVLPDIVKPPQESTKKFFNDLINKWRTDSDSNCDLNGDESENENINKLIITDSELVALKDKNNRQMRLRELLSEHSKDSTLIVMTLPMPRKGTVSAGLYMAWLETLSYKMPPFMFIRGDQTNVLTFYS